MSLSATLFGRNSAIFKATNILGLGVPGWLDKKFGAKDIEGPRLSDLTIQTSTYGADISRIYGRFAQAGNIIALENNKLKETSKKNKSGGKGGQSSEPTVTYTYSATFLLALCEGPIVGVRRIWCSDKLIYNAGSNNLNTILASNKRAKGFKIYLGTDSQMPDSRYEAKHGVGNVSAYRGLAYIAFYDFQLADYSNTLQAAQFKVEIITANGDTAQLVQNVSFPRGTPGWVECSNPSADMPTVFAATSGASYSDPITIRSYVMNGNNAQLVATESTMLNRSFGRGLSADDPCILVTGATAGADYVLLVGAAGAFKNYNLAVDSFLGYSQARFYKRGDDLYVGSTFNSGIYRFDLSDLDVSGNATRVAKFDNGTRYTSLCVAGSTLYGLRAVSGGTYYVDEFDTSLNLVSTLPAIPAASGSSDHQLSTDDSGNLMAIGNYSRYAYSYTSSGGWTLLTTDIFGGAFTPTQDIPVAYYSPNTTLARGLCQSTLSPYTGPFISTKTVENPTAVPLSDIILSEVKSSSLLTAADVDVSSMTATVRGYRVGSGSIRSALEPLQTAFPFDVIPSGYKIKCVPRGQSSALTIPWEDLGAGSGEASDDVLKQSREMDSQLPVRTSVQYVDEGREYAISEQYSERLNTSAVNKVELEVPVVLLADQAAGIAEMQNYQPWLERTDFAFTLPPKYLQLESSDVVTVQTPTANYSLRLTDLDYTSDGMIECKGKPNAASLYTPNATGSDGNTTDGTIGLPGQSFLIPLDIPVVDETYQNSLGFVAAVTGFSDTWPGALLLSSSDDGQTYTDLQGFSGKATAGFCSTVLAANDGTLIDESTLLVGLYSGSLDSLTQDQMLAGANYAAYGVDGRWEIIRFRDAVLQTDGRYLLQGFKRGERGTEWATGLHATADFFVLLDDPDNIFIGLPTDALLDDRLYLAVTQGDSADSAEVVDFTYRGVNLETLSGVYPAGVRDGSGNLTATWTRRSRLASTWWINGVDAPVGETTQAYEVDVMNGSTVVRTISATTPSISYTATQQATDFGSAQSSIALRIYQLSGVVGRGYPLAVTL